MLTLSLSKSATMRLCVGIFLFSTSAFAQSGDESGDPEPDPSYELPTEPTDPAAEETPPFPEGETPYETTETPETTDTPETAEPAEPAETIDAAESKSTWSLLREGSYSLLPGIAMLTPSSAIKDLAGTGIQFGLLMKYHMPITGPFGIHYGLDLRMAKLGKDLAAPAGVAAKPSSRLRQSDVFALAIGEYTFSPLFAAFVDFGFGVQYRALYIKAESSTLADDYFAGYGFGYVLRLGGKMDITKISNLLLVSRLYFGFEGGSDLESGKLKYNHKKVDINGRQTLVGIDLGVQF